jgi:formylglycine-generating enzyme required for sulfatase activity
MSTRIINRVWMLSVLVCLFASTIAWANTPPEVTNVYAGQRPGTRFVDITYDLFDADGDPMTVKVYLSIDGGATFPVECLTLTGDMGAGVISGTGLQIIWDAGLDYPDDKGNEYSIMVEADDGQYVVPDYVLIPSGTFTMGSPETEIDREIDEILHEVTLTHDFWMQGTEVTNQQYADLAQWAYDNGLCVVTEKVLVDALDGSTEELLDLESVCEISFDEGLFSVDEGKSNYPVMEVTWWGAAAYCDWLSLNQGLPRAYDHVEWQCNAHNPYSARGYRLPTEAEFEYACRAGTATAFNTGDCLDAATEANFIGTNQYAGCPIGPDEGWTLPVTSFPPNALGLYEMHGNVREWCNDWDTAYDGNAVDPTGLISGNGRIARGGSWDGSAGACRSADRYDRNPGSIQPYLGFRPVKSADAVTADYVLIPSGAFMMGSPETEVDRNIDETPHEVTLTHDFWMQGIEVTNQQYADLAQWAYDNGYCTATTTSLIDALDGSTLELLDLDGDCEISFSDGVFSVDSGKGNYPVMDVTWWGAAAYCDWLSLNQGLPRAYDHGTWLCNAHNPYNAHGYRLPTEAEFEYACRAGTHTPFNTGDCLDAGTEANYNGGTPYTGCPSGPYVGWTVPVGSYSANAYGLYDIHGNMNEWCNDWYSAYGGTVTDPVGLSTGSSRILRGGRWAYGALYCRSAYRGQNSPGFSYRYIGFRPVRTKITPIPVEVTLIEAGTFTMGSLESEVMRDYDELQHTVTLTRDFLMQTTEVSQAEYLSVTGTNPSNNVGCGDCPVEWVTWYDAIAYCNAKSVIDGLTPAYEGSGTSWTWNQSADGWRLPTEAEWEYACRSGTTTFFNTGDCLNADTQANYRGTEPYTLCASGINRQVTIAVGSFPPSSWGLRDMHGNVWEWCWDYYQDDFYVEGQIDPVGQAVNAYTVIRGGSWYFPAHRSRSANRGRSLAANPRYEVGFRLVRWAD